MKTFFEIEGQIGQDKIVCNLQVGSQDFREFDPNDQPQVLLTVDHPQAASPNLIELRLTVQQARQVAEAILANVADF